MGKLFRLEMEVTCMVESMESSCDLKGPFKNCPKCSTSPFEVIKNNLHPQSFTCAMIEQPHFASCFSMLLDFLIETTLEVLYPNFPISLRRSSTYYLWEIRIPCLEYATSILGKYFNFPNSFISNCVAIFSFKTRRRVSLPSKECLIKKKAFLTSNCCKFQPKWAAKERITLTMLIFATGANYNPPYSLATPIILPIYYKILDNIIKTKKSKDREDFDEFGTNVLVSLEGSSSLECGSKNRAPKVGSSDTKLKVKETLY
ncbi:hypothetical protein CR513_47759, partial [Mucuna pruriens]